MTKLAADLPGASTVIELPSQAELHALKNLQEGQRNAFATNIIPADLVQHSLFAGSNFSRRAARPVLKDVKLFKTSWMEVTVSGEQLGQREADIYGALLALAALDNSYTIKISRADLFERLGLSHGTNTIVQFNEDLNRLQDTKIEMRVRTVKRSYSVRGGLLFLVERQDKASGMLDKLRITLNPKFSSTFCGDSHKLYISFAERLALRDDALAGWLQSYFRTKTRETDFELSKLRELAGFADMRTDKFNEHLVRACASLAPLGYEVTLPRVGSRIDSNGIVIVKHPGKGASTVLASASADTTPSLPVRSRKRIDDVTPEQVFKKAQRAASLRRKADFLEADVERDRNALRMRAGLKTLLD